MGFYSIYKIIKDVFQTIFGRRFFRIILIFLVIFLIFTFLLKNNVFGYTDSEVSNGSYVFSYDSEYNAYELEKSFTNYAILLIDKYGQYNASLDVGNSLGYLRYLLQNSGGYIFCYPGDYNNGTDLTYNLSTNHFTIVYYNSSSLNKLGSATSWFWLDNLRYEVFYSPSDKNSVRFFTVDLSSGEDVDSGVLYLSNPLRIPQCLSFYTSDNLTDYLSTYGKAENEDIILAIQNQTETISGDLGGLKDELEDMNNFFNSTDYDENEASNSMNGLTSDIDDIDDSSTTGLFTAIFNKFNALIDESTYNQVETINIPVPFTDGNITLTSDIISSRITDTFISTLLNVFWYFLFGMYLFKFINNIYRSLKSGNILNGFENNNEVITNTML